MVTLANLLKRRQPYFAISLAMGLTFFGTASAIAAPVFSSRFLRPKLNTFSPLTIEFSENDTGKTAALPLGEEGRYFHIYFENRLRYLDDKEQDFMRRRLNQVSIWVDNGQGYSFHGTCDRLGLVSIQNVPRQLMGSLLVYAALAHELEHSLQVFRLGDGRELPEAAWEQLRSDDDFVIKMEESAILAEWFFLHFAPESMQTQFKSLVGGMNSPRLNHVIRAFVLPFDQYLRAQSEPGGYSTDVIIKASARSSCDALLFRASATPRK